MNKAQLLAKTKTELLELAQRLGLRGISTLKKGELVDRVNEAQVRRTGPRPRQPLGVTAAAKKAAEAIKRRAIRKRIQAATATAPAKTITASKAKPLRTRTASVEKAEIQALAAHKFDVTPPSQPAAQQLVAEKLGELPEAYGTGRLFLTARDPHWLYAYWDLSSDQLAKYRTQAVDGRVVLRVWACDATEPLPEITLLPNARNWYISVPQPAVGYKAQLGYWKTKNKFHVISESREATTPTTTMGVAGSGQFVTIPIDVPFRDLLGLVHEQIKHDEALAPALQRLQSAGHPLPFTPGQAGRWTEEQQKLVTHLMYDELLRRVQTGSFEFSETLRRRATEEVWSGAFSPAGSSWGSGALGQPQKGFWFAVNAELIIYGATEPDAKVTVDGKPIKLREDGTFSFHYIFPDGKYQLPCVAISAAGDDQRSVDLSFERVTTQQGDVGRVKQPAHLKSPAAA